jgi:hypothetical protein
VCFIPTEVDLSRSLVLVLVLAVSGCASWNSSWGILSSHEDPQIAAEPIGANGQPAFAVTTKADADPRIDAQDFCSKQSRYARLTGADRAPATDPAGETITWHFDCIN